MVPLIYKHGCVGCRAIVPLPLEILAHITPAPGFDKTESLAVAFACPHCKRVQTLEKRNMLKDRMANQFHAVDTVNFGWLKCDEGSCKVLTPLYAWWSVETTVAEREADIKTWEWVDLKCPEGHVIQKP